MGNGRQTARGREVREILSGGGGEGDGEDKRRKEKRRKRDRQTERTTDR